MPVWDCPDRVLNHRGECIYIDFATFKLLKKVKVPDGHGGRIKAVVWNKQRRMWQLTKLVPSLMDLWLGGPEFTLRPPGAINPERFMEGGPPRDGGRANRVLNVLGCDVSGLPAPSESSIRRLRSKPKEQEVELHGDGADGTS